MFLACRRLHSSKERLGVAGEISLSPAWWLILLFCPCSPLAWPLKGKQGPGTKRAGVFWFLNEASQCYCIKSNKLQNFSDWKGMRRPCHNVFSWVRKDVKSSDWNKSCPCNGWCLRDALWGLKPLKDPSSKGPGLSNSKAHAPGKAGNFNRCWVTFEKFELKLLS